MLSVLPHQYLFIYILFISSSCYSFSSQEPVTGSEITNQDARTTTSASPIINATETYSEEKTSPDNVVTEGKNKYTGSEHSTTPLQKVGTTEKQQVTVNGYSYVSATPHAASMTSHDVIYGPKNNSDNITGPEPADNCPSNLDCYKLGGDCISCQFNNSCVYGQNVTVLCSANPKIICRGPTNFTKTLVCRYCYQTPHWQQRCTVSTQCRVVSAPRQSYTANCTVRDDVICLGRRKFYKRLPCNWTSGYRWSTALALSITLGGFGADRFYLGLWREGIGKLFSFGGLGVWTLLDVVLIATGYVGPADGSVYI